MVSLWHSHVKSLKSIAVALGIAHGMRQTNLCERMLFVALKFCVSKPCYMAGSCESPGASGLAFGKSFILSLSVSYTSLGPSSDPWKTNSKAFFQVKQQQYIFPASLLVIEEVWGDSWREFRALLIPSRGYPPPMSWSDFPGEWEVWEAFVPS